MTLTSHLILMLIRHVKVQLPRRACTSNLNFVDIISRITSPDGADTVDYWTERLSNKKRGLMSSLGGGVYKCKCDVDFFGQFSCHIAVRDFFSTFSGWFGSNQFSPKTVVKSVVDRHRIWRLVMQSSVFWLKWVYRSKLTEMQLSRHETWAEPRQVRSRH